MIEVTNKYCISQNGVGDFTVWEKKFNNTKNEYYYSPIKYPNTLARGLEIIAELEQCDLLNEHDMTIGEALEIIKGNAEQIKVALNEAMYRLNKLGGNK